MLSDNYLLAEQDVGETLLRDIPVAWTGVFFSCKADLKCQVRNRKMRRLCLVLVVVLGCGVSPILSDALPVMASDAGKPTVAGWVEYGWIGEPPVRFKVKLDTGAKNSSINAPSYREFKKDGATFIAFKLVNELGQSLAVEEPIVRVATIRRAGVGSRQRPVIMLKTCVAGVTSDVEFTIADRSDMTYPVLIGRTFLADAILVHSDRSFLKTGSCTN